jgi:putative membrane protein
MTRTKRSALLATAALAIAAVTVAGCGSPSQYPHSKENNGQPRSSYYRAKTTPSPTVASTLAPAGSTTVVAPAQASTTTVLVPARPATTTVLVPATTVSPTVGTVGSTVLVPAQVPASTTVVTDDLDFMARASQFNATEIALSRVAYQRAQSPAVRDFALETIKDHRRMADDLDSIALRRNLSLAWTPSPAGSRAVDDLSRMSGYEVDRYYLAQMIADHDAGAALYAGQGNLATDVTLRSTAGGDAIDLRNRRDQAIRLQADID